MTNNSSIHIAPVQTNTEQHNLRQVVPGYVNQDLLKNNPEPFILDTVSNRMASIKAKYQKSVGQSMQKKATPIREGVLNLKDTSEKTMEQLKELSRKLEETFGVQCFQIFIHADEGHYKNKEDKEKKKDWIPNYHAHMVFDFTNKETGKALHLKPLDMIKMQTMVAETLEMKRGESSDKEHLHHMQYKNQQEEKKLQELQQQNADLEQEKKKSEQELKELNQKEKQLQLIPIQNSIEVEKKPSENLSWLQKMFGQKDKQTSLSSAKTTLLSQFQFLREKLNKSRRVLQAKESLYQSLNEQAQKIKDLKNPRPPGEILPKKGNDPEIQR